jgi:hypothetical protein
VLKRGKEALESEEEAKSKVLSKKGYRPVLDALDAVFKTKSREVYHGGALGNQCSKSSWIVSPDIINEVVCRSSKVLRQEAYWGY